MTLSMLHTLLFAQDALVTSPPTASTEIPAWGWMTIVAVLASSVATLGGLYKQARDREVAATLSKVELLERVSEKTDDLLERAIEAFTHNKTSNEQIAAKLSEFTHELRELKAEVRRAGEKTHE